MPTYTVMPASTTMVPAITLATNSIPNVNNNMPYKTGMVTIAQGIVLATGWKYGTAKLFTPGLYSFTWATGPVPNSTIGQTWPIKKG